MTLPRVPADPMWDQYLQDGEYLVWHGRPNSDQLTSRNSLITAVFGVGFLLVGIVIGKMSWTALNDPQMWWIWVLVAGIMGLGGWMVFGNHYRERKKRQSTWYSLTNRRAFIGTDLGRKDLSHYPIDDPEALHLLRGSKEGADYVYFAKQVIPAMQRNQIENVKNIGFELISDADHVFNLIQRIQRGES